MEGTFEGTFDDVLALLHREVELYRRILRLCQEEQVLLLTGSGEDLMNVLGDLQVTVNTLSQVSRARMSLAERLNVDWSGGDQERERGIAEGLKAFSQIARVIAEIAEVNEANERLIEGSLEYISFLGNYVGDGPELRRMIYAARESRICDQHSLDLKR
ncbi:MAG TPA: flagellar protein FlgN [Firmicutes bacterium]|nr:flagellar protein FlgN [Bacillota bacterium]